MQGKRSVGPATDRLCVPRPGDPWTEDPALEAELYELVAGGAPFGFALTDPQGRLLGMNPALAELWRLSEAEVVAIRALGRSPEAYAALAASLSSRAELPGPLARAEPEGDRAAIDDVPLRDGRVLERQLVPARDGHGRVVGRIALFSEATGRRVHEREMRARTRQAAALAALAELAMNAEDTEPLLHAACGSAAEVMDADAAALLEWVDGTHEVRAAAGLPGDAIGTRLSAGEEGALGWPAAGLEPRSALRDRFGFVAAIEVVVPGRDGRGGLLGAYTRAPRQFTPDEVRFLETAASVLASAMARRQAEEELLERERQLRAVFDSALDAMVIVDDAGAIRDTNPAACALLVASRPELLLSRIQDLVPARAAANGPSLAALPASAERIAGETEVGYPGRRTRTVEFAAIPGILPGRHLGVMRDVSERKHLHARLALADRMVSVGTLAAGVAHELNNPLAYVNANLSFLGERVERVRELLSGVTGLSPEDGDLASQLADAIRDARDGAERMRIIIRDLRTFSRADDEKSGPVDVRPVLDSCINMAWNEIRHRARLVKDLGAVPPVRGSEARLGQVFLNLLVNAAQAIPEGRVEENEIRVSTRVLPDGRVGVEVRDSGCGIPAEHLGRVFDPFFTTKPPGVGTGLGLAICHSIVTGLGGEISVETRVPGGTVFQVALVAAGRTPAVAAVVPPPAPARPRGRVLGVDDEPLVGPVIQRALQAEHEIVVASSARAALERVERGETFDVILSDLLMPEMTGMELYRELTGRAPSLARRMVFLTGGAFTPSARAFLEREPVVCVEKPFELDAIRKVLLSKLEEGR